MSSSSSAKAPPPVTVRAGSTLSLGSSGQTGGMERYAALTEVSGQICSSLMVARARTGSDVHHHGDQDTVVYCVQGAGGCIESEGGAQTQVLNPGDWALIPAHREHREVNDTDHDITWVIVRAPGGTPKVVNLTGWGGEEAKS